MCPQFGISTLKNDENVIQRYKKQFKRRVSVNLSFLYIDQEILYTTYRTDYCELVVVN